MGSRPAPSYANIFMAKKIDPAILRLARELESDFDPIDLFKRFLDDIFMVYTGSIKSLHQFLSDLNNLHPSIKFTMSHTTPPNLENPVCECKPEVSLPFLDTSCKIVNGKIVTDLYRKETDRNQYLLPSSCHPAHVTENIPYSLALRIVRICTFNEDREKRFLELKNLLLSRNYKSKMIDSAINKARSIPRNEALKKVYREKTTSRPVFVMHYDPRLPSIPAIVRKHWRTMTLDPRLKEIFPDPPLVAYKRPKNVRDTLIRSKVPPGMSGRPRRELKGMKKCNKCGVCSFVKEGSVVKANSTNYKIDINCSVDCSTKNVIYMLGCRKCPQQYIGETERMLKERFLEHRSYVSTNNQTKSTGAHFTSKGHSISDMEIIIVEKMFNQDPQYRKQREKLYIQKFNTKYKGLNRINGG